MPTLRLSPSGPYINNGNGGGFNPQTGAVLRSDAVQAPAFPASASANIPSAGVALASQVVCIDGVGTASAPVTAELANPDPGLNYKVTGILDVNSATTAGAVITMYLDFSNDGGTTWDEIVSNTHAIGPGAAAVDVRQIRCDMLLKSGAALNVHEGDEALVFRMRVTSPTPAGSAALPQVSNPANAQPNPVGTIYLELTETF